MPFRLRFHKCEHPDRSPCENAERSRAYKPAGHSPRLCAADRRALFHPTASPRSGTHQARRVLLVVHRHAERGRAAAEWHYRHASGHYVSVEMPRPKFRMDRASSHRGSRQKRNETAARSGVRNSAAPAQPLIQVQASEQVLPAIRRPGGHPPSPCPIPSTTAGGSLFA